MGAQEMALEEYQWAINQVRSTHGLIRKWIIYAGEQLEIAGVARTGISSKLRQDLPEFSAGYITQICSQMGWTDGRFSCTREPRKEVANSQPQISSEPGNKADEEPDMAACTRENQAYIDHLQDKIEFLQYVQNKLRRTPFLSLLDRGEYDEYILLCNGAEQLARQAWDNRQIIPIATQFYLAQIITSSTIKHGASEYVSRVKELFGLTSKQVTKTLRGVVRQIHYIYEPTSQLEALFDGFYGKPCESCGSWRVRWENGICHCFACQLEYRAKAEKLLLARPNYLGKDCFETEEPTKINKS